MLDRRAWEKHLGTEAAARAAQAQAQRALQLLAQAAVPIERLTGSDHWDTYVRMGEKRQEVDRAALAQLASRMMGAGWVAPAELAALRHHAAVLQAAIDARAELLELPRRILLEAKEVSE